MMNFIKNPPKVYIYFKNYCHCLQSLKIFFLWKHLRTQTNTHRKPDGQNQEDAVITKVRHLQNKCVCVGVSVGKDEDESDGVKVSVREEVLLRLWLTP